MLLMVRVVDVMLFFDADGAAWGGGAVGGVLLWIVGAVPRDAPGDADAADVAGDAPVYGVAGDADGEGGEGRCCSVLRSRW